MSRFFQVCCKEIYRSLVLILPLIIVFAVHVDAQSTQSPQVSISSIILSDADIQSNETCSVSASITNAPIPETEHTLVPHWSWSIGMQEYSANSATGPFSAVSDGSSFNIYGSSDDTQPNANFSATCNSDGYYLVEVFATVEYIDPNDSTQDQGPFTGSTFASGGDPEPSQDDSISSDNVPASISKSMISNSGAENVIVVKGFRRVGELGLTGTISPTYFRGTGENSDWVDARTQATSGQAPTSDFPPSIN